MIEDKETFRDSISTVNQAGKRIWIFPKKPFGKFFSYRKIVSYFLLLALFGIPHIKVSGKQLLLFDILNRKFILFGKVFWPQDLWLFALMMIVGVVFIILFTIIFGRLFCGWICPQTIFMEMVFRRIEYWIEGDYTHQKKLKDQEWNYEKIKKRILKHSIFWVISFLIANTFLAYIIGSDKLWMIQRDPINAHFIGFISIIIFTTIFYLVFSKLREQVCTTICPYGRLQGVLLDQNSMVVAYDYKRGEQRSKFRKNENRQAANKGDCIDCNQCVLVCPTGIDIRNGTQLECVNCTACIDACDHMMEAVGLPKQLISFKSENNIKDGTSFQWTSRVKAYSLLLLLLIGALVVALVTRSDFEASVMRQRGATYTVLSSGRISNIFEIDLTNKTNKQFTISLEIEDSEGIVELVKKDPVLNPESYLRERFLVELPLNELENGSKNLKLIIKGNGVPIQKVNTKFIGPML